MGYPAPRGGRAGEGRQSQSRRGERKILTVSELAARVKDLIERSIPHVWIEGEISNFVHHASGHMYFSLKDERSQISAAFFAGDNRTLKFRPENGMKVYAFGSPTIYGVRGAYQIVVSRMQPAGVGDLELAFRQLKDKLDKEGLFRADRKRPIPRYPRVVALVTSPSGAAVHDMLRALHRRFPLDVKIIPVRVQGDGAARDIAAGLDRANRLTGADVILLGRGGGSLEDLWAFNEEIVARAVADSRIPVVTGIGHEVDTTIADFVADLRAATPTAAAELVVPDRREVLDSLRHSEMRLARRISERLALLKERLARFAESRALAEPRARLLTEAQRLDDQTDRMARALHNLQLRTADELRESARRMVRAHRNEQSRCGVRLTEQARRMVQALRNWEGRVTGRVELVNEKLAALDPLAVLKRGYAIARTAESGATITDASTVAAGDAITIRFRKGEADAVIERVRPTAPGETKDS